MKVNKTYFVIAILLVITFIFSGCGIVPAQPKGTISGQVLVPPGASEMSKDITGWVPAAGATVTVVDANGVTHTATTDENGYYSFENIAVKSNTVVTATVTVDGKTVVLKGVIPQTVAADEDYEAGTMTPESTALALVVEELIDEGISQEDIALAEVQASETFTDLVEQVTTVIEEQGNVTEDPEVIDGAGNTADEIINPPAPPSPPSPPGPPAAPVFNGTVSGIITTSEAGVVTGTLTGDFEVAVSGNVTEYTNNRATFTGTVSGEIKGDITASINANGIDTLSGHITGTGAAETVRIIGIFPQSGTKGDFEGEVITGPEPTYVESMTIKTEGDAETVAVGGTLQMTVEVLPAGASDEVVWSVWTAEGESTDTAIIDQETGILTGMQAGTVTVIAKALDGSLKDATKTVIVTNVLNTTQNKGYDTVQAAINEAISGDTILVGVGTYFETIDITKDNLIIQSVSGNPEDTIIDANGADENVVDIIGCSGVTINGFTIKGAVGEAYISGVYMENVSGCSLSNSVITAISTSGNGAYGINLKNATDNNFDSIAISDITGPGNVAGVMMYSSNGNSFSSTAVFDIEASMVDGFTISGSENSFESTTISNLIATTESHGFYLVTGSSSNSFSDTEISNLTGSYTAIGINLWANANANTFISTKISHFTAPEGSTAIGVYFYYDVCDNSFSEYDISGFADSNGTTVGIYTCERANSNSFTGGSITGEKYGVYLWGGDNSIHFTNIVGNTEYGVMNKGTETFDATNNWWGSPDGPGQGGANGVSANVTYNPWYINEAMTELSEE